MTRDYNKNGLIEGVFKMTDVEIKPIHDGISFMRYLGEIFTEYGEDFGKMLCEDKLSIESERRICFYVKDWLGNNKQLEITLRDVE